eukprot:TRINITY_DN372_c0_g1_i5.p1 TRINITY_DN372_c0_g1~~TRINITY_DN372_c0_g1_i5.p1  ORF type:complete len:974 (+),score=377.04 TRINITY_DN372_c0_g1_i5:120-2924(+)
MPTRPDVAYEEDYGFNLDEHQGESSCYTTAGLVFSIVGMLATLGLTFYTAYENDTGDLHWVNRTDKFHPQEVAIRNRWFSEYAQVTHLGEVRLPMWSPFIDNKCLCADPIRRDREPVLCANWEDERIPCAFKVPYLCIWSAMSASFFGFLAVSCYASSVMQRRRGTDAMHKLGERIANASMIFLKQEYCWLAPFVLCLWVFIFTANDGQLNGWRPDTSVSFLLGSIFSAACGYMGMSIATQGNVRTAAACASGPGYAGLSEGLQVAFRSGACMGIGVVSFGILGLCVAYAGFGNVEALGGFGFGASAVALFARVGGGIYTKAADVGGDLCGKVEAALDEDNPKNPATIADCVGDNVGDTAGMGADLFESFVGSVIAAMVLGAAEFGERGVALPLWIATIGLVVSVFCTLHVCLPKPDGDEEPGLHELLMALTYNVVAAGVLIVAGTIVLCMLLLHRETEYLDDIEAQPQQLQPGARLFSCIVVGLLCGILIGKVTEYFTSHTDEPTRSIARSGQFGPGPVVIEGLGQGMYSTIVPMVLIASTVLGSYYLAGLYGTAIACVGMLSTLGVTMSTDAYGPVSDNAGGIAEMCQLPAWVRESTDKLDALGNTTAATGKGFSNGSAVLAALSLLGAFTRAANVEHINLLKPEVVVGILIGALQPYIFSAMTMLSVNKAAQEMMAEVRRQFQELKDDQGRRLLDPSYNGPDPDYDRCIKISTDSSLKEMLLPGSLAIFSPLTIGFMLGSQALTGFLLGAIASGYLLGVQMSNTGGAWDNAKKWVEAGEMKLKGIVRPKKSLEHAAVVVGDTIGDPYKDTSGPSLNILIKLMTQFSFVIAPLLDEDWDHVWVGVLLFACAVILFLIVSKCVVSRPELPDDDYYDTTEEGVHEKLDFLDGLQRRIDADLEKISKGRDALIKVRSEVQEQHADAWGKWQHENK